MKPIYRVALTVLITSFILISTVPRDANAYPYKFQGYLKDTSGNPIPLATIYISGKVYDMGTQDIITKTWNTTTDEYGKYVIWIGADEPDGLYPNSAVTISYSSGNDATSTTVTVKGLSTWGNLTFERSPALGDIITSPAGIFTIIIITSIMFIGYYLLRTGKDSEEPEEEKSPRKVQRRRRSK